MDEGSRMDKHCIFSWNKFAYLRVLVYRNLRSFKSICSRTLSRFDFCLLFSLTDLGHKITATQGPSEQKNL